MFARLHKGFFVVFLFTSLFLPHCYANAAAFDVNNTGIIQTAENSGLRKDKDVPGLIGLLIRGALGIIGAIFLILIVYGGFLWMISEGDNTKVSAARGYIFHSILGLIITLSAYALTDLIIKIFTDPSKGTLQ